MKPGIELERYVARRLSTVEKWAGTTINSGAVKGDADIATPRFQLEAKDTGMRKNFIIQWADWTKLQRATLRERTPEGGYKMGLFCTRNSEGTIVISMDLEDFIRLLEEEDVDRT